jgi:integrase
MGRRGRGEGSIYQDATGRWRGYVELGYVNGRRRRKYLSGATRREVAAAIRAATDARDAGTLTVGERTPTVSEWLTTWVDTIAAAKVRPSTLATYRGYIVNRINPEIGHHRLDRLQPEHLEAFYRDQLAGGLSGTTVLHMHRIISRALKVAHRRGRVARNVATLVDAPRPNHHEVDPLTATEARRILGAAVDARNAARWSVALSLGLRQGEALGLQWSNIDLERGTLTVKQALQRKRGGGLTLVPPKSNAGRRTILLPAPLLTQLREHRAAQNRERLAAGSIWQGLGFVFTTPRGTPIDPRNDHRAWHALLTKAAVRRARLHDARHTAATLLLAQGVPARVAMQILGHSQITLTLGTYSHVVPELAQDAADRMAAALWGDAAESLAATLAASEDHAKESAEVTPVLTWDDAVRRQGLEPRTRGLRVRCSAS